MSDRTQSWTSNQTNRSDDMKTVVVTIDHQKEKFTGILPSNVKWEDFRNTFLIAVQTNPKLLDADRPSLWLALQKAASDGLKPDAREGALVIFGDDEEDEDGNKIPSKAKGKKKVVWMPMVWGIVKQMRNTGNIASVRAKPIYAGERVVIRDENGQETYVHERVIGDGAGIDESPENIIGAYAVVQYKDGFWDAEFMSLRQLMRSKAVSKAKNGPWKGFFPQMCIKTPLRRLALRIEKSAENARYFAALEQDESLTIDGTSTDTDKAITQRFAPIPDDEQTEPPPPPTKAPEASPAPPTTATAPNSPLPPGSPPGEPVTEVFATDEFGEPANDEPMTPKQFAQWYAGALFRTKNPGALAQHNADAIQDASTDAEAKIIIEAATKRGERTTTKTAPPTDPEFPRHKPIIALTPKGAFHSPNFLAEAKKQIATLTDETDLQTWITVNSPTYHTRAVSIGINNALDARRKQLGLIDDLPSGPRPAPPPPTPAIQEEPTPEQTAAHADEMEARRKQAAAGRSPAEVQSYVLDQIKDITSQRDLALWSQGPIKSVMQDMKKTAPEVYAQTIAKIDEISMDFQQEPQ